MSGHVKEMLGSLAIDRTAVKPGAGKAWALAGIAAMAAIAFVVAQVIETPLTAQASGTAALASVPASSAVPPPRATGMIASGYVVARRSAVVSADISGRLTKVNFEEGASVKEGQLLAQLDDGLARYDLELAQARLQSSRAAAQAVGVDMTEGEAQLRRAQQLSKTSTISPAALEAVRNKMQSLGAQHDAAIADVRVAQVAVERQADLVERHNVRAPFAGVIVAKSAQGGEVISASAAIATLVDMKSLEVDVDVNEGQIGQISKGQMASVVLDAYPDLSIAAVVLGVTPTADRDRATIQVRVGFSKLDPRVLPQMAARVTFERMGD